MLIIQVCGCEQLGTEVVPFVSHETAEFYGVYMGEPGEYKWHADFADYDSTLEYAEWLCNKLGATLDDKTFEGEQP